MKYVDEYRDGALARHIAAAIAAEVRARPHLRLHGVLRRPYPRDLALRYRGPAARQRAHDPRSRLPGLRASGGADRRRHRARPAAGRHAVHLCRHDARAGLEGRQPAEGQGRGRGHPHDLLPARRRAHRRGGAGAPGGVLRHRLRDHDAADRGGAEGGGSQGPDEFHRILQPRADAGGDARHPRYAGAPTASRRSPSRALSARRMSRPSSAWRRTGSSPRTTASPW